MKPGKRGTVSFATKEKVNRIPPLSSLSAQEIRSIWYTQSEIETIAHEADVLILEAEDNIDGNYLDDSMRGLERKTEDGHAESFLSRVSVYDAVLEEQNRQCNGAKTPVELDFTRIARLCEKASSSAKFSAFQRGKKDEVSIQSYLRERSSTSAGPFSSVASPVGNKVNVARVPVSSKKNTAPKPKKSVSRTKSLCSSTPITSRMAADPLIMSKQQQKKNNTGGRNLHALLQREKTQQSRNVIDPQAALAGRRSCKIQPDDHKPDATRANPDNSKPLASNGMLSRNNYINGNRKTKNMRTPDRSWINRDTRTANPRLETPRDDVIKSHQETSGACNSVAKHSGAASTADDNNSSLSSVAKSTTKGKRGPPMRRTSTFKRTTEMLSLKNELRAKTRMAKVTATPLGGATALDKSNNKTITPKSKFPSQGTRMAADASNDRTRSSTRSTQVAASRRIVASSANKKRVGRTLSLAAPIGRPNLQS